MEAGPDSSSLYKKNNNILTADSSRFSFVFLLILENNVM